MTREQTFEDWKRRAVESDILQQAVRLGAKLKRAGREWIGPCPFCGGTDRFSINPMKAKWHCRGHGGGGDAIGMVMHIAGLSFLEAIEDITGEPPPGGRARSLTEEEKASRNRQRLEAEARQQARKAQEQAYQADTREAAQAIWDASMPVKDSLAETYLRSRGIVLDEYPDVLRFHPALPYPGKPKPYPVLVCRVDDVMGHLTAVWRIFLRDDGHKADVENPKLGLGPAGGGAVRLGGMAPHIGIGEGLESSMGAWMLVGRSIPVWATLSTSGMAGFEIPLGVSRLTIFPDGDRPLRRKGHEYEIAVPAGRKASHTLFARASEGNVRAAIAAEPPPEKDYANLWLEQMRDVA